MAPQHFAYPARRLAETGKPVWVCETGVDAALEDRGAWMKSQGEVKGVAVILTFDRRIVVESPPAPRPIDDDWRWSGPMVKAWEGLPR